MANFPTFPTSGKNAKVKISTSDGQALVLADMTLQASSTIRGKTYTNLVYKLGTGKTLINMRPEKQPVIDIDGILDGLEISPGIADKVSVTSGTIEVDGVSIAVPANTAVSLTNASAASTIQWNAIVVDKDDQTISAIAGTPSADTVALLDTFGDSAGQRPLVPSDQILIGWVQVSDTSEIVPVAQINYYEQETGGVDYELLPNLGGCKLQTAITKLHAATIGGTPAGRAVKFTGNYLDAVISEIGTASEWTLTTNSSDVSAETFASAYGSSSVSGFSVTFSQLLADKKVINAVFNREGHCAIVVMFPNGFGWQSAATVVPNLTVNPTSMNSQSVTAALLDFPEEVE